MFVGHCVMVVMIINTEPAFTVTCAIGLTLDVARPCAECPPSVACRGTDTQSRKNDSPSERDGDVLGDAVPFQRRRLRMRYLHQRRADGEDGRQAVDQDGVGVPVCGGQHPVVT